MLIAAALLLLFAGNGRAFELRVWPLLDVESRDTETTTRLLGPLVEWRRDEHTRSFTLRPLFQISRSLDAGTSHGSLAYPLITWQQSDEQLSVRFFGAGNYIRRSAPAPGQPYTRRLRIFPFVFYERGPDRGASLSIVPFYANVEGFLGYERMQMLLFPLFFRLEEPLWDRTWLPFPFFSRVGGKTGAGTRFWPFYGETHLGAEYDSSYRGWPFYIRAVEHPGREDAVTTRVSWPLFATIDGPRLTSRIYGFLLVLPLYTHTIDHARKTETTGYPWPFWLEERGLETGERTTLRMTPIYQKRQSPVLESRFWAWPFYRRKIGLGDSAGYERTDVLFLMYRDEIFGDRRPPERLRALVPLWVSREREGATDAQAMALLDGLFPGNDTVRTLHAPLYRIFGEERRGGETRYDILWRMWSWGDGKLRPPWYWSRD